MTFNQLHYALVLRKKGNFKRAADQLGISQPALSLQIQKLEEEIGIKLFDRRTNPVEASEDGAKFLLRAQDIVNGVRKLEQYAGDLQESYDGKVEIGIIPTLAPFLVPLFINQLQKDFPNLRLMIKELTTNNVVTGVREGTLDAGIISTPIRSFGIESTPLFYERFYIYTGLPNTGVEFSLDDIDYKELWLLNEGNCFRDQINDFCDLKQIQQNKALVYQSNSIDALIRIVDTKGGTTILPELTTLSLSETQEDYLKSIKGKPKAREIGLITTPQPSKQRYIDLLQTYILQNIPAPMLQNDDYEVVDPNIKV